MVRTRLHLAVAAWIVGAVLCGCNGSDSSDASGALAAMPRPGYGLAPWGSRAPDGSNSTQTGASGGSPSAPGAVTLSWDPPTENTNDTPLSNLAGYTIHYGTQPESYTSTIQVTNPGLTTYVVENLPAGTYYFAVSAYTTTGESSADSPQVTATVE